MAKFEDLGPLLADAKTAAERAGEHIKKVRASGNLGLKQKGEIDFVTEAYLGAEKIILEFLRERYPTHGFLSEETSPTLQSGDFAHGPLWIIDPVDGTTNFSRGINHTAVSIGFYHGGKPAIGVVHAPFLNETYWATAGGGAFLNGKQLKASAPVSLKQTLVATGFPYARDHVPTLIARAQRVLQNCQDVRRMGAASLDICAVAAGTIDAYYEDVAPWDMAAGVCIALEAGARFGHYLPGGEPGLEYLRSDAILVASPAIYEEFLALLRGE